MTDFARDLAGYISDRLPLLSRLLSDLEVSSPSDVELLHLIEEQLSSLSEDAANLVSELNGKPYYVADAAAEVVKFTARNI